MRLIILLVSAYVKMINHVYQIVIVWLFLVILDSGGHTRNPNRTSCPRRVTAVTLGLFPRLMHIRSLSKTSGIGPMTWDNFPEITATHKPLRHHLRTWPSNKSPKTKDLKQVVNLTPVFFWGGGGIVLIFVIPAML